MPLGIFVSGLQVPPDSTTIVVPHPLIASFLTAEPLAPGLDCPESLPLPIFLPPNPAPAAPS